MRRLATRQTRGNRRVTIRTGRAPQVAIPAPSATLAAPSPASKAKVQWTLALFGFLLYLLVITSYRLPLGEVAILISLVGAVSQSGRIRVPPYLACFIAFAVWSFVATTQTVYPEWTSPELIKLVKLLLIVFAAANALRTPGQVRVFMVFFLGCFALFPLRGAVFNFFLYHNDMRGRAVWNFLYSNPNDLGAMALLQLSMATTLLVAEPKGWVRWSAMAGVVALPILILMTQSRGVFLGLSVFVVIAFFGQRRRVRLALRLAVVAAVVASAAPSSVWARLQTLRSATNTETLNQVDGEEGSARQRWEIWQVAFKIIRDNPVTGVGFGAYRPTHEQYALRPEFNPTARGQRDTHSLYFNVLAETGFPGLVLYVTMITIVVFAAERARRRCKRAFDEGAKQLLLLEAGLLSFLVASIFGSLPYLPHFLLHLVLIYAMSSLATAQAARNEIYLRQVRTGISPGEARLATAGAGSLSRRALARQRRGGQGA